MERDDMKKICEYTLLGTSVFLILYGIWGLVKYMGTEHTLIHYVLAILGGFIEILYLRYEKE